MKHAVVIRRVEDSDRDAVEALWSALFREQEALDERFEVAEDASERWRNDFDGWLRGRGRWLWVAEREGRIVGFLSGERYYLPPIYRAAGELFLNEIYVVPESRRQGIGRALVDAAIGTGREEGIERMRLTALSRNEESREFWRSIGADAFSETLLLTIGERKEAPEGRQLGF